MKTQSNTKINKTFVLTLALLLICTLNLKAQWTAQSVGMDYYDFNSVYFVNADTGYVVGVDYYNEVGLVFKTTDGGTNWVQLGFDSTGIELKSVYFINADTGYIVGNNWDSESGNIFKTTDGGTTWVEQSYGALNLYLFSAYFLNADTGFAVGCNFDEENYILTDYILKTTDGGLHWTTKTNGLSCYYNSVYFIDANTGYAIGSNENGAGVVMKTIDGGENWISKNTGISGSLNSVYFLNADTGYTVGFDDYSYSGIIYKTVNGGNYWILQKTVEEAYFYDVDFPDANIGYAVGSDDYGNGLILKTKDGGVNWIKQNSGNSYDLMSVDFIDTNIGYTVGYELTVLKTTNGGETEPTEPWGKIGTKWTYWIPQTEGNYKLLPFEMQSTGDTIIEGKTCYKLENIGECSVTDLSSIYIYTEYDKVYYYDDVAEDFLLLYDFSLNAGDEYYLFLDHGYFTNLLIVYIDSVGTEIFNDSSFRVQYVTTTSAYISEDSVTWQLGASNNAKIVEFMGSTTYFFPQKVDSCHNFISTICSYQDEKGFIYTTGSYPCGTPVPNSVQEYKAPNINIYPNPAHDQLTIENTNSLIRNIRLYDLSGKTIQKVSNINQYQITIPLPEVKQGLYFISVTCDEGVITKKVIVR